MNAKVPQPLGLRDSRFGLAVWTRLELATPCVTGRYSNQLNYQTEANKLGRQIYVFVDKKNLKKNKKASPHVRKLIAVYSQTLWFF